MENNTFQQEDSGNYIPTKPEPYYGNIFEKIACRIGIHGWPYGKKSELRRIRKYLASLEPPHGDEPAIYCYRCNKLLNHTL